MKKISYQISFGLMILIIGVLLLLRTTGIYDTGELLIYTPSLFVLFGIYILIRSRFRRVGTPFFLIVLFGTFQLIVLEIVTVDTIQDWWPLLIILAGLWILIRKLRFSSEEKEDRSNSDRTKIRSILGGVENINTSNNFKGGEIFTLFGGAELNLKLAEVKDTSEIKIVVLFGGTEIIVPENWNVNIDVFPILGGVEDKRSVVNADKEKPDLKITGFVGFGGFTLKN
ncbi:putative transmembrane protein [Methanosalsum zhilinae DSM 4017]|uniref:Putative transmembrane protein n=1 Tax=Methanosalsum zhilinae (strain DSM 4017 / NBRC 107636 / OCM 62 / WeN5) TaxID=679901 RepID=F7XLA4_METZD|nr:LiaF domain-containing protein [Methanosalsum zhilinae]AEH60761.1 putative transmembrane protein [Methanosalsum zhilinae DSM 4017]